MAELISNINEKVLQAKQRFGIVGNSPALLAAIERALRVAPIDLSVLIIGESGAGKEFFPQIIHAYGTRKHAKYIAVNCGAIPEGTIESELFGHERGSFTGAVSSRKGYFEEADGGTIFLDEVAELPLTTQARLLRVLETGEFMKVGSSQVQRTNVRIVAATNVDMQRAVAEGRFREDLYYRLSTVQIDVPPLRYRGDDIVLLARKFARDFAERYRMPAITFSPGAREVLLSYRWPGNVRQLKNVVEQLGIFDAGQEVDDVQLLDCLPHGASVTAPVLAGTPNNNYDREREMLFGMILSLQKRIDQLQAQLDKQTPVASGDNDYVEVVSEHNVPRQVALTRVEPEPLHIPLTTATEAVPTPTSLDRQERIMITEALQRNGGRRKAAAAELGISERTLYRKIKEYGLE